MQDTGEEAYAAAVLASMEDEYPIGEAVVERAFRFVIGILAYSTAVAVGTVLLFLWLRREEGLVIAATALVGFAALLLLGSVWLRPWLRSIRVLRSAEGFHVSSWPHTLFCKTAVAPGPSGVVTRYTNPQGDTVGVGLGYGGFESLKVLLYGFTGLDDILNDMQASRESVTVDTLPWGADEELVHFKRPRRNFLTTGVMVGILPTAAALVVPFEGFVAVSVGVAAVFFTAINLFNWVMVVEIGGGLAGPVFKMGLANLVWLYILIGIVAWVRWWTG